MVQIIQQNAPLSTQFGQMFGQSAAEGLAKNLPQPELQTQGRLQQQALSSFESSLTGQENPAQLSMKWAQAMAGIPGSENLAKSVLPQYQQMSLFNLFNQGGQNVGNEMLPAGNAPMQAPIAGGQQPTLNQMMSPVAQQTGGGLPGMFQGPQPMPSAPGAMMKSQPTAGQGIDPRLLYMSSLSGIPVDQLIGLQQGVPQQQAQAELAQAQTGEQEAILQRNQNLANLATERLGLKGKDLNDFQRIGQKYQNLPPEEWLRNTERDYQKFEKALKNWESANIPSTVERLFKGGKYRDEALKNLQGLTKPLMEAGYENELRTQLQNQWLSPAEIEMVLRPLDQSAMKGIKDLPKAPYQEDDWFVTDWDKPVYGSWKDTNPDLNRKMTDKVSNYLQENLKPGVSLLGTREMLRKEKGLDWQQYLDALQQAQSSGLELTAEQLDEYKDLTYAPRDSVPYIFQGWGNWFNYFRNER